jgi:hypothetical protein
MSPGVTFPFSEPARFQAFQKNIVKWNFYQLLWSSPQLATAGGISETVFFVANPTEMLHELVVAFLGNLFLLFFVYFRYFCRRLSFSLQ